jgi:hypothetical protein
MRLLWLTSAAAPAVPDRCAAVPASNATDGVGGAHTMMTKGEPVDNWLALHSDEVHSREDGVSANEDNTAGPWSKRKRGNLVYRLPMDVVRDTMGYL